MNCQFEPRVQGGYQCHWCGKVKCRKTIRNCPALASPPKAIGFGDTLAHWLAAIGVTEKRFSRLISWMRGKPAGCGCKRRRRKLNWLIPYPLKSLPEIWARRLVAPWIRWARSWREWLRPVRC